MKTTHEARLPSRRSMLTAIGGLGLSLGAGHSRAQAAAAGATDAEGKPWQSYDDFADPSWPSPRWSKFRSAQHDLWDPDTDVSISGGRDSTLTIDLPRFSVSHPNHVKALLLSTSTFDVQQASGLSVRVDMQVNTYGTERNPFGLEPGDVRLAAGALVLIDPDTGMVFDFFVSADRIRPLYERLPFARAQLGDYPAYTILGNSVPTRPGVWHRYEIRYRRDSDRVEWLVDGRLLARQDRVGAAPGEDAPIVKLRRPRIGGGLFTLLDDLANDRRRADDHSKIRGFIPSNWEDRFGQGAKVAFRRFEVSIAS